VATRLTWLPKLIVVAAVALLVAAVVVDRLDASGPVGYSLVDRTTRANPLVNAPSLAVSSGSEGQQVRTSPRPEGSFSRFQSVDWSLDEPLTIEIVPAYPGEPGHSVEIDLRDGGANVLNEGWYVRVAVVATDRAFDIEVSQPTTRGLVRSHRVVHRVTLLRADERRLFEALQAEREREEAELAAAQEESRRVALERAACIREETSIRMEATAPVRELGAIYQEALDRRRIYGTGTITFAEYRRRITSLAADMQAHLRDAERVLATQPAPAGGEFTRLVEEYSDLRQAWRDFEVALRTERYGPGQTFQELHPREAGTIERIEGGLFDAVRRAASAGSRVIRAEAEALCDSRHPAP
jgi:hypothetical protein